MLARERTTTRTVFIVFTFLWAVTVLVDRAKRHDFDLANLCVVVPGLLLAAFPGCVGWFALFAASQVFWWQATLSTQIILNVSGILHCCVLLALGCLVVRHRTWRISPENLLAAVFPQIRVLLVLGMWFAGFAKLNHDFLQPEISCGAVYYLWIAENPLLGWLPTGPGAQHSAVWFATIGEFLGPPLLLFRRTRLVGLGLLFGVWFGLAMSPRSHYVDFAGLFAAMSILFVPPTTIHEALVRWRFWLRRLLKKVGLSLHAPSVRHTARGLLLALMSVLVLGSHFGIDKGALLECYRYLLLSCWLGLGGTIAWSWFRSKPVPSALTSRTFALVWLGPLLFLSNEVAPYVGFPHRPSMTMAANLQLTPLQSNHLVVNPVPTFSWSKPVTIVKSSKRIRGLQPGRHMPYLQFVDMAARHPDTTLRIRIDGGPIRTVSAASDPEFASRSLLARLLRLRTYGAPRSGRSGCTKAPPGLTSAQWRKELRARLSSLAKSEG